MKNNRMKTLLLFVTTVVVLSMTPFPAKADVPKELIEVGEMTAEEKKIITSLKANQELHKSENKQDDKIHLVLEYAMSKLGYGYSRENRNSGTAFDCSSLVYYSYKHAGIDISYQGNNTAAGIAKKHEGQEVKLSELMPGDLIFYSYKQNGRYKNISHVALYAGDGMQIEASSGRNKVVHRNTYTKNFVMACRPLMNVEGTQ